MQYTVDLPHCSGHERPEVRRETARSAQPAHRFVGTTLTTVASSSPPPSRNPGDG
jgi:hypothetical protein